MHMIYEATLVGPLVHVISLVCFTISLSIIKDHNVSGEAFITNPDYSITITPAKWIVGLMITDIILLGLSVVYQINNQIVLPKRLQRILFHVSLSSSNLLFSLYAVMLMTGNKIPALTSYLMSGVASAVCYSTYHISRKCRTMEEKMKEKETRVNFRVFHFLIMDLPLSFHTATLLFTSLINLVQEIAPGNVNQLISEVGFIVLCIIAFFGFRDVQCMCIAVLLISTQMTKIVEFMDINEPWTAPELSVLGSLVLACLFSAVGVTLDVVHVVESYKKENPKEKMDVEKMMKNKNKNKKRSRVGKKDSKARKTKKADVIEDNIQNSFSDETQSIDIENWKNDNVCKKKNKASCEYAFSSDKWW